MNITAIIFAAVVVGGVGILIGFFLGVSGEKFKVEVDEREVAVTEALPGGLMEETVFSGLVMA